jgi:hypothetical protein
MPGDTSRLTANRMIRIKKVLQYLAEHLNVSLDPACYESNIPKQSNSVYIELFCNGRLLYHRETLASVKYVLCKGGPADLCFQYLER